MILKSLFRVPFLPVALSIVLPAIGFYLADALPIQFFPASDRRQIQIEIELPASSPLTATAAAVARIQPVIEANTDIQRAHWFVGRSAPTFYYNVVPRRRGTPFYAQGIIDLANGSDSAEVAISIEQDIAANIRNARVVVRQLEQGPPFDAPIEVQIQGPDLNTLKRLGGEIRLVLSQCPHVTQTRSDLGETIAKLVFDIDPAVASNSGVDQASIASQLYARLEGLPAGTLEHGGQSIPIRVVSGAGSNAVSQLASIELASQPPSPPLKTPLASLAKWTLGADNGAIVRVDGKRTNEVMAYLTAGVLPDGVLHDFKRRLKDSDFRLPPGYKLSFGGENRQRSQAVNQLVANAVILFALMVLTLVLSFGSLRHTLIVMLVGGLSIGLGPLALWVGGFPFGFMAIVGTMGLVGVAINDSIVVLAAIAEDSASLGGDIDSTCDVVIGCTRHILATTLTTIAGFTPLILAGGKFWPPLAMTVAGGVGGATLMALLLAPSLHLILRGKFRGVAR
jgi:multidrug efflux pump subunit AcrB